MTGRATIMRVAERPAAWAPLMAAASLALFAQAMGPRLVAQFEFGPICSGHSAAWALHCPSCYVAAALGVLALLLGWAPMRTSPSAAVRKG